MTQMTRSSRSIKLVNGSQTESNTGSLCVGRSPAATQQWPGGRPAWEKDPFQCSQHWQSPHETQPSSNPTMARPERKSDTVCPCKQHWHCSQAMQLAPYACSRGSCQIWPAACGHATAPSARAGPTHMPAQQPSHAQTAIQRHPTQLQLRSSSRPSQVRLPRRHLPANRHASSASKEHRHSRQRQ